MECGTLSSPRLSSKKPARKLRSTTMCCFRPDPTDVVSPAATRAVRSPYTWLKSTAQDLEIRDRYRRVRARNRGSSRNNFNSTSSIGHGSAESFSYDPLSYALNFEDESRGGEGESYPSFTERLPASPKRIEDAATTIRVSVSRGMVRVF